MALVAVLGLGEVGELRIRLAVLERVELVVGERVALPDEPVLVGVDDRAVRLPELDADDVAGEDTGADEAVELRHGPRLAIDQRPREVRLDDAARHRPREHAGVADRLALTGSLEDEDAADADDDERDHPRQRELDDGVGRAHETP